MEANGIFAVRQRLQPLGEVLRLPARGLRGSGQVAAGEDLPQFPVASATASSAGAAFSRRRRRHRAWAGCVLRPTSATSPALQSMIGAVGGLQPTWKVGRPTLPGLTPAARRAAACDRPARYSPPLRRFRQRARVRPASGAERPRPHGPPRRGRTAVWRRWCAAKKASRSRPEAAEMGIAAFAQRQHTVCDPRQRCRPGLHQLGEGGALSGASPSPKVETTNSTCRAATRSAAAACQGE